MKMKTLHSNIIPILAVLFLAGCATTESTNTKSLLTTAGFHVKTPQTALQKEIYKALPAYHVARVRSDTKVLYAYKDEKAGVAYVGREPEYQRYKQLCIQQQVAQQYYMAAEWDQYYANRWYGAWGPGYW